MASASCPNTDSIERLFSYYENSTSTSNEQQQGLYMYAVHGNQKINEVTFQQQFMFESTVSDVYTFYCKSITQNGKGGSTNCTITFNGADYSNLGLGTPISILQIK
jgi:light-regulated signal transduction histidine kinase (bacteriophytochrome)